MVKGIDISLHNGNVDMKKVKDSGIEFVIIRLGYGIKNIDAKFWDNYENAINNKIKVGVYFYSYAKDKKESIKEAEFVLDIISKLKIDLPVFIDMEDADGYKNRNNITNDICIEICKTFCTIIENAGYNAGIYANLDWLKNKINDVSLDRYDKWVAQWNCMCTYDGDYLIWQYTNKGKVNGILGYVDMNYYFKKNNKNTDVEKSIEYVVKGGDNLIKIAKKYNVSWKKIYEINKEIIGDDPNKIIKGQVLKINEVENE